MKTLSLNGSWQVKQLDADLTLPATVPGVVHLDLLNAGKIPPIDWRDNEEKTLWVSQKDWQYSRDFQVDADFLADADQVILRCEGLDTVATVAVNGQTVIKADNMFRTWEADVKSMLKTGVNTIIVTFTNCVQKCEEGFAKKALPSWNCFSPLYRGKSWLRKMPCSFGWDWGPMAATCGIFRDIKLLAVKTARIDSVLIEQKHNADGSIDLVMKPQLLTAIAADGLQLDISAAPLDEPQNAVSVKTEATGNKPIALSIKNPKLWWPNGLGPQDRYLVIAKLLDANGNLLDEWSVKIGLRKLELDRHADEWGESFQFTVNGKPFFAKGANWVPADYLIPRLTKADYDRLVGDAANANMNFLRAWGGGFYEQDDFFDACDRFGVLIWQDFIFACSTYPTFDKAFMANIEAEFIDNLKRIRHHPALALLCGNNELEQGLVSDTWNQHSMSWEDYSRLFDELLPKVCSEYAPQTPYWPCSPHTPHGDRRNFNDPTCGDAHCWDVWFGGKPFEFQRTWNHRFMSEFGFQSFPELKTVEAFTDPQDRNLTSYIMDYHQRSGDTGNRKIFAYMLDWYKLPSGLEETLWLTQISQAMAIQYACEHARRTQPRMMGVIYWQINDIWPCASWSSIDSFGRWKALHYLAKRFFAPNLLSLLEIDGGKQIEIHVSNTTFQDGDFTVKWHICDLQGKDLQNGELPCHAVAQEDRNVLTVDCRKAIAEAGIRNLIFYATLEKDGVSVSSNYYTFDKPKHLDLFQPTFSWRITPNGDGTFAIRLKSSQPALFTRLELSETDARFSDNFFFMPAKTDVNLTLIPKTPLTLQEVQQQFRVHSLYDSYAH